MLNTEHKITIITITIKQQQAQHLPPPEAGCLVKQRNDWQHNIVLTVVYNDNNNSNNNEQSNNKDMVQSNMKKRAIMRIVPD